MNTVNQTPLIDQTDICFFNSLEEALGPYNKLTIRHIYCLDGEFSFVHAAKRAQVTKHDGLVVMSNQTLSNLVQSEDLRVTGVCFSEKFIRMVMPSPQYGTKILLAQMLDPVLHMTEQEQSLALAVMSAIRQRFIMHDHLFYYDVLIRAVQTAIFDHFDLFARNQVQMQSHSVGIQTFHRFIEMLDHGAYREHRKMDYYAEALYVTPKYLSELSVKASGRPASYWIDFFTSVDIACLLQNSTLSAAEIVDKLHFASLSYFSHYVKSHFGVGPQEYRRRTLAENRRENLSADVF